MAFRKRLFEAEVDWAELKPQEFSYVPCNICGSFDFTTLASFLINRTEFFMVKCNECGLIWRNPLPGQRFLYSLYGPKYFDIAQESGKAETRLHHSVGISACKLQDHVGIVDKGSKDRRFRDKISDEVVRIWISLGIRPADVSGSRRRLLEVGGGRGYLQRAAQRAGWETTGLEISPHGIKAAIANGFLVFPIPLDDLCTRYVPHEKYFDTIVFYDFLEHVEDPARVLRMMNLLLSDAGHIIFRIPETTTCPRYHLIDHIWHFPLDALDALLQKENFDTFHAHYSGSFKASNGETYENITFYAKKLDVPPPRRKLIINPNPLEDWLRSYGREE